MVVPRASKTLSFECPPDYELFELSKLMGIIRTLYDKLELLNEGYEPFSIYDGKRRWNRGRVPTYPLLLRRIRYGSSLRIVLLGGAEIRDVASVLSIVSAMTRKMPKYWWQSHQVFMEAFWDNLPDQMRRKARNLSKRYDLSPNRFFGYVGPEIDALSENRARKD